MKALVVSHSCATNANRAVFAELAKLENVSVSLLVPKNWRDEFGNAVNQPGDSDLETSFIPVVFNGHIILHAYILEFRKYLSDGRFDAVFVQHEAYGVSTWQVARAVEKALPQAAFGFSSCQNLNKSYPPPFSWGEKAVYRRSDYAFPITPAVGEVLRAKGYRGLMRVCPLPVDLDLMRKGRDNPVPVDAGEGGVVLGFVGRFVEAKGVRTLISALELLPRRGWRMLFIGSGPLEEELKARVAAAGLGDRVGFFGFVAHRETPRYLSAMDILVLPSETRSNWKEQFGRVIPEALACGACVVGSDSGEIPRLIRESGGGRIFPEGNPAALAGCLESLISAPAERAVLAEAGRRWVEETLSTRSVAAAMAETLTEAVAIRRAK